MGTNAFTANEVSDTLKDAGGNIEHRHAAGQQNRRKQRQKEIVRNRAAADRQLRAGGQNALGSVHAVDAVAGDQHDRKQRGDIHQRKLEVLFLYQVGDRLFGILKGGVQRLHQLFGQSVVGDWDTVIRLGQLALLLCLLRLLRLLRLLCGSARSSACVPFAARCGVRTIANCAVGDLPAAILTSFHNNNISFKTK